MSLKIILYLWDVRTAFIRTPFSYAFISHLYITLFYCAFVLHFFLLFYIFNPYHLITDIGVCKVFFHLVRLPSPVPSGPLALKRPAVQLFPLVFISTCYIIFYKAFVKKSLKMEEIYEKKDTIPAEPGVDTGLSGVDCIPGS